MISFTEFGLHVAIPEIIQDKSAYTNEIVIIRSHDFEKTV